MADRARGGGPLRLLTVKLPASTAIQPHPWERRHCRSTCKQAASRGSPFLLPGVRTNAPKRAPGGRPVLPAAVSRVAFTGRPETLGSRFGAQLGAAAALPCHSPAISTTLLTTTALPSPAAPRLLRVPALLHSRSSEPGGALAAPRSLLPAPLAPPRPDPARAPHAAAAAPPKGRETPRATPARAAERAGSGAGPRAPPRLAPRPLHRRLRSRRNTVTTATARRRCAAGHPGSCSRPLPAAPRLRGERGPRRNSLPHEAPRGLGRGRERGAGNQRRAALPTRGRAGRERRCVCPPPPLPGDGGAAAPRRALAAPSAGEGGPRLHPHTPETPSPRRRRVGARGQCPALSGGSP